MFLGGRSSNVPKSVHRLRPGDIDVIAAMGDSLTVPAAATAVSVLQLVVENRGLSGSIGGQETWRKYLTLPNILKVRSFLIDDLSLSLHKSYIGFVSFSYIGIQPEVDRLFTRRFCKYSFGRAVERRRMWFNIQRHAFHGTTSG